MAPVHDAPLAAQFPLAERQRDQRFLGQFLPRNPKRKHTDPDADFHHLFDRFHASEVDGRTQSYVFLPKIFLHQLYGVARLLIDDIVLSRDRILLHMPGQRPRMERAYYELEFIGEERAEFELILATGFQAQSEIDPVAAQHLDGMRRVTGFDLNHALRKTFLQFAKHQGEDVLAGRRACPYAQTPAARLPELIKPFSRRIHGFQDFIDVNKELLPGLRKGRFSTLPVQ